MADAEPDPTGRRGRYYSRLNELIAAALDEVKPWLLTGAVSGLDRVLGTIDDRLPCGASGGSRSGVDARHRALAPA